MYNFQTGKCLQLYSFEEYSQKKRNYKQFLTNNNIDFKIIKYDEILINLYPNIKNDIKNLTQNNINKKHG